MTGPPRAGIWAGELVLSLWAVAALCVDFRIAAFRIPVGFDLRVGILTIVFELKRACWVAAPDRQLAGDAANLRPWNDRLILNGTLDELLYDRGRLVTGGLPFAELKQREHINAAAQAANQSPEFSALIRAGRIGF